MRQRDQCRHHHNLKFDGGERRDPHLGRHARGQNRPQKCRCGGDEERTTDDDGEKERVKKANTTEGLAHGDEDCRDTEKNRDESEEDREGQCHSTGVGADLAGPFAGDGEPDEDE